MKSLIKGTMIALLLLLSPYLSCQDHKSTGVIDIGIISVIEHPALDQVREGFIQFLSEHGYKEGSKVRFDYRNAKGSMENAHQIAAGFVGKQADLVLSIGTTVAKVMAEKTKDIPILFAAVTDPVGAGLVNSLDNPGGNVTGTSDMNPVFDQLSLVKEILPGAARLGILYNPGESNSVSIVEIARQVAKQLGIHLVEATSTKTAGVQAAVASLVGKVDAVYMPTDNTMAAAIDVITDICTKNRIPFFSSERESVKEGATLASICVNYLELGRQTGAMALKVLSGGNPASIPVEYQRKFDLVVNKKVAKALGIALPQSVLDRAQIIGG